MTNARHHGSGSASDNGAAVGSSSGIAAGNPAGQPVGQPVSGPADSPLTVSHSNNDLFVVVLGTAIASALAAGGVVLIRQRRQRAA
jgi:hypothetical protein